MDESVEAPHVVVERRLLEDALRGTEDATVLDAGCGRTTRLDGYRDRIARLVGVDLDDQAGRENRTLDEFVVADLCGRLPFADGCFDLVYANFVVEHLFEPSAAFAEWQRVLRPGGSAVVLTSNVANPLVWLAVRAPRHLRSAVKRRFAGAAERDVMAPVHRANTPERLEALMAGAGFACEQMEYVATLHRYAERLPRLRRLLHDVEAALPEARWGTIVARYRAA
jgi:SAM-dependent methyltransferase